MNLEKTIDLKKTNFLENTINLEAKQNNFLENILGKTIDTAINISIRAIFPNLIENQIIDIKDALLNSGLKEGINTAISSALDLGKSTLGIITGKFDNISQAQLAIEKGGIIDSISSVLNRVLKIATERGLLSKTTSNLIKNGKDGILNNVSSNIEKTLTNQMRSAEKLDMYISRWKDFYDSKDFNSMDKEYKRILKEINNLLPIENTIKEARKIENLHNLIKNNGENFNISKEQVELANRLS